MNDLIISTIRTMTPGATSYMLVMLGVNGLDRIVLTAIEALIFGVTVGAYYLTVRLIAIKYPKAERLLGSGKMPTYGDE